MSEATLNHVRRVAALINACVVELLERGDKHDQSKLEEPEASAFAAAVPLDHLEYGSPAYEASKASLKLALEHHYARNRHHPQHFKDGVNDMHLIDILEMLCDWKASSERHNSGNLLKSIHINAGLFGIGSQLQRILENTAHALEGS